MTRRTAALLTAALPATLARAEDANQRWSFLRTNLSVFPGTEKIFEPDDDLFWKLKANLTDVSASEKLPEGEWPFQVSTDADGRRVCPAVEGASRTALFLGDSCTFGIPVEDEESFPAQCQKLTPGLCAVNAGVPGYSAFQGRLLLERIGPKLRPDIVVITFWVNGRTVWDHLSDLEHHELLAAERAGEMSRHRITRLLRRAQPGDRPRLSEEELASEIRTTVGLSREIGAKPLIVVWPTTPQMEGGERHPRQAILLQVAEQTQTTAADLANAFRIKGGRRLFVDPIHATREGYHVAAETVASALGS